MTAQASIQAGAGDIRTQELTNDGQKIIQRQQQGPAQIHHNGLLCRGQMGLQPMGRVRTIRRGGTVLPLVHRAFANAITLGQHMGTVRARGNLGTNQGRCPGILV